MSRAAFLLSAVILVFVLADLFLLFVWPLAWLFDAAAFYRLDLANLYDPATVSLVGFGVFRYSPAIAALLVPLTALPWWAFAWVWLVLTMAAAAWIGGRRWWWLALLFPFTILEIQAGNIHLLIAAAVVAGFRWPAMWSFIILTKVTPGIGLLWFAFRGEWRALATALGTTGLIVLAGLVIAPGLWREWVDSLVVGAAQPGVGWGGPLWLRLLAATALLAWAAPRGNRWAVPIAVLLGMPSVWPHSLAVLVACVPLVGRSEASHRRRSSAAGALPAHGGDDPVEASSAR